MGKAALRETDYAYAAAYVRTLENRLLKTADIAALVNAASPEAAAEYLADIGYGNSAPRLDVDELLRAELLYTWNEVKSACPNDAPLDIFLYQNDFHNLKTIIKAMFSAVSHEGLMLEPHAFSPEEIHAAVSGGSFESLPEILRDAAAQAYGMFARDNGQLAEISLDKALCSALRDEAARAKSGFLAGWAELSVAIMNMKTALRGALTGKSAEFLQNAMPECGRIDAADLAAAAARDVPAVLGVFARSGFEKAAEAARISAGSFEKWCDDEIIRYARSVRHKTFGIEPVFAFLLVKQYELQTVRIILSGLRNGMPPERLRERLRDLYV